MTDPLSDIQQPFSKAYSYTAPISKPQHSTAITTIPRYFSWLFVSHPSIHLHSPGKRGSPDNFQVLFKLRAPLSISCHERWRLFHCCLILTYSLLCESMENSFLKDYLNMFCYNETRKFAPVKDNDVENL